tara:strand:- start:17092 stop:17409 length:318 start_codon:yes stop_codon:yes gene_type:complete
MLGSMGADNPFVSEELEDYLKAKQNADEYLKSSGLYYTIVRLGSLTDLEGTGKIQLKGKLESFGKISRADVAQTLVEVLEDDIRLDQLFEIITGETLTQNAVTPH